MRVFIQDDDTFDAQFVIAGKSVKPTIKNLMKTIFGDGFRPIGKDTLDADAWEYDQDNWTQDNWTGQEIYLVISDYSLEKFLEALRVFDMEIIFVKDTHETPVGFENVLIKEYSFNPKE